MVPVAAESPYQSKAIYTAVLCVGGLILVEAFPPGRTVETKGDEKGRRIHATGYLPLFGPTEIKAVLIAR